MRPHKDKTVIDQLLSVLLPTCKLKIKGSNTGTKIQLKFSSTS